jgi:hypothetical protein
MVVGAFVVIAVNTMIMAHLGVIVNALGDMEVSALMDAVLTHGCCQRWFGGILLVVARLW